MKKFVFTLEAVARYKSTVEKKQKAELSRVMARLSALYREREEIERAQMDTAASLVRSLARGRDVIQELQRHDHYQMYLRALLEEVKKNIVVAEAEKKRIQALLLITLREQKALERLRSEQYQAYLEDVYREESLVINDLIAHRSTVAEAE